MSTARARVRGMLVAVALAAASVACAVPEPGVRLPDGSAPPSAEVDADLTTLPRPDVDVILPAGLPRVEGEGRRLIATPIAALTAGHTAPGGDVVVALSATAGLDVAGWYVTDLETGWVQVLTPYGRGALPSQNPARVNGYATWVRASQVSLAEAPARVVVSLADRELTLTRDGVTTTIPVGVGRQGAPTPSGLGQISEIVTSDAGHTYLTSLQSEVIDSYAGSGFAATALHADPHHGATVGRALSDGCVRLRPEDFAVLDGLPLGTPVVIRG
ncbi:L,D-transpeptidase [Xylanimonas ulmi]|uniref:L,D-transpeptidase-like protein n=1 Tax=Xylanimonas ulmi TaxID=228973 RepID=A0A4Q7M6L7_9MICO|nr:L,D-transpeptidase [Xylanibacterium ulmi]RZS62282.1 L,D-transpeptidase-like protein [Xylanibacterium ulmi]